MRARARARPKSVLAMFASGVAGRGSARYRLPGRPRGVTLTTPMASAPSGVHQLSVPPFRPAGGSAGSGEGL